MADAGCTANAGVGGLVVGLYKLSRAVKAQAPAAKVDRIVQFLSQTLAEMPFR
jgi:hypothetical protein